MSQLVANHHALFTATSHVIEHGRHQQSMVWMMLLIVVSVVGVIVWAQKNENLKKDDEVRSHDRARHLTEVRLDHTRTLLAATRMGVDVDSGFDVAQQGSTAPSTANTRAASADGDEQQEVAESESSAESAGLEESDDPFLAWQAAQTAPEASVSEEDELRRAVMETD